MCGREFDPDRVRAGVPQGICTRACSIDRKRVRAAERASRRRVPPRAPSKLFAPSSRDWSEARAKCDQEGRCRVCRRRERPVEAAHILPRSVVPNGGEDGRNIVPLCREHHGEYDADRLDLLPWLSPEEQSYAVELAGGIIAALRIISGKRVVEV